MSPQRRGSSAHISNQEAMGRGASRGPLRMSFDDLHALVKSMEARLDTQDKEIQALKKDNAELWQQIHRLKGARFPFEIFSAIILSIAGEKKALSRFSLVSWGWMSVARRVLFNKIQYSAGVWSKFQKMDLMPILSNPYCTVFPFVQHIDLTGTAEGGFGYVLTREMDLQSMERFLLLIPKFIALRSLVLTCLGTEELEKMQHCISRLTGNNIKKLSLISSPYPFPQLAAFVSAFPTLETLIVWAAANIGRRRRNLYNV